MSNALINRDFARLWYGQAVSMAGDFVFDTTVILWIATRLGKGQTWAPAAVAGVALVTGMAIFVVGPVAGVFCDRWNHRRTMLRSETIRALLVGALAALAFLPIDSLPIGAWLAIIYVTVFLVNSTGQFFVPSRMATIGEIVEGETDRAKAFGLSQATASTASVIGPPLAAPLMIGAGIQLALIFNAVSYVVSWFSIKSISKPDTSGGGSHEGSSLRAEFVAGLRYFRSNRYLVALVTLAAIGALGTGAINTLGIFFVTGNLHASSNSYGFMSMAYGIGEVAGALLAAMVVARIGAKHTTWLGISVAGVIFAVYSRQTHFAAAAVLAVLTTIPVGMLNTSIGPILLGVTPREYLGRVVAVFNPITQVASMLSTVLAGWLASTVLVNLNSTVVGNHFGPIDTIFAGAALLLLLAGVYGAFALPSSKQIAAMAQPASAAVEQMAAEAEA